MDVQTYQTLARVFFFVSMAYTNAKAQDTLQSQVQSTWLLAFKEIRMVGALAQLHHNVEQTRTLAALAVDGVNVLLQNLPVEQLLHLRHRNVHVDFRLRRQALRVECVCMNFMCARKRCGTEVGVEERERE